MDNPAPMTSHSIERATVADIPFIMSVERLPGYAALVGSYGAAEHARRMAASNTNYLLYRAVCKPVGFAVVRRDEDGMGNAQLHRIAVMNSGKGHGSAFLRGICNMVFEDPEVGRFWLDLLPTNVHAKAVYAKIGFTEEGVMRSALRLGNGRRKDLTLMSILRDDWLVGKTAKVAALCSEGSG